MKVCLHVSRLILHDSKIPEMNLNSSRLNMGTTPIIVEETYFVEVKFKRQQIEALSDHLIKCNICDLQKKRAIKAVYPRYTSVPRAQKKKTNALQGPPPR